MKALGKLAAIAGPEEISIAKANLITGINDTGDHFIKLGANGTIDYVINKICDHAGGRLILREGKAVCPMHGWTLDLNSLQYAGADVCKESLDFVEQADGIVTFSGAKRTLSNPQRPAKKGTVTLRWLNHATVYITCNGVSLITDPWLFGPAFMTGWWLANPSPAEAIDLLKSADYVFLSHNHPDHLHAETLAVLPKDARFIVPAFTTGSVAKYLQCLGYTNISALDFNHLFELTPGFQLSLLKSGDFRDDAGLYLCANGQEILLTVDANFLNSHILPTSVDLLMTSFAGGASGFPLCFENYTHQEKENILRRNRKASRFKVQQYLEHTRPTWYMPYAGMFAEAAPRDAFVKTNNKKNKVADYAPLCEHYGITLITPRADQLLVLDEAGLRTEDVPVTYLRKEDPEFYLKNLRSEYPLDFAKMIDYFAACTFRGQQILQLIPADDDFNPIGEQVFYADFSQADFRIIDYADLLVSRPGYRVMQMRVRPEALMCVLENKLPWEDLSIGFQVRINRSPNEYESDFWYYFTNIYIGEKDFRYSSFCGACTVVEHNVIWAG